MTSLDAPPRLLLVEDDVDIQEALQLVLSEEGYQVRAAASLADALAVLQHDTFDFVLTDVFYTAGHPPLHSVLPLLAHAAPTPVGIITAWNLSEHEAQQAGFTCLIRKPFDFDALMTTLAGIINKPLTPEQVKQARIVWSYLAAIVQYDFDQAASYVTDEVIYHTPAPTRHLPHTRLVRGKADFLAYQQQAAGFIRDLQIEQFSIFPHPTGLAVRYTARWVAPDDSHQQLAASLVFHFAGELISRFGFQTDAESAAST